MSASVAKSDVALVALVAIMLHVKATIATIDSKTVCSMVDVCEISMSAVIIAHLFLDFLQQIIVKVIQVEQLHHISLSFLSLSHKLSLIPQQTASGAFALFFIPIVATSIAELIFAT